MVRSFPHEISSESKAGAKGKRKVSSGSAKVKRRPTMALSFSSFSKHLAEPVFPFVFVPASLKTQENEKDEPKKPRSIIHEHKPGKSKP